MIRCEKPPTQPQVMVNSQCAEFIAPFQRHFGFEIFYVATNARPRGEFFAVTENHGGILPFQIARNTPAITAAGVADVTNVQIEMIAPEKMAARQTSHARQEYCAPPSGPAARPLLSAPPGFGLRADRASARYHPRQKFVDQMPLSVATPAFS